MARPDKAAAVAEMADEFRNSNAAVLTEYRGLTVKQLRELRRALGDNVTYAVVKNTLTKIAAMEAGVDAFDDLLQGPSAIAFIKGDAVEAAKALRDFGKENPPLVIKAGVLDGKPLTPAEISKIADLESREVLLGMLAGALLASLQNAVSLFNAPLSQAARVVGALQAKAEGDPSILAGGAGTPAPAIQPEEASDGIDGGDDADGGVAVTEAPDTDSTPDLATPVADEAEAQPEVAAGVAVTEAPDTDSTPETLEGETNNAAEAAAGTEAATAPEETTEG